MPRAQTYKGRARTKGGKARCGPDDSCCCEDEPENIPGTCGGCHVWGNLIPANLKVTITGSTNGLNGTYILPHVGGCTYDYVSPSPLTACNLTHFRAYFTSMHFSAAIFLEIYVPFPSSVRCTYWHHWAVPTDCRSWPAQTLTLNTGTLTCFAGQCTATVVIERA